ncbi:serine acetyltransferase [Nostoc sp. 'Peltigera membranacea cyanobiont' 213]|uniref:serine O-acetyltransferase n=1 Tax=unclassified Nostoc TaxID=2593658 RepID=UPI000B955E2A|nr:MULTISPECIES: serine acetyltransferase [unclassified Nostoc]AVH64279.1 serine acetyltransferase [Nostoc sp. 'Peltigera membranacea cyanobiont' N6]OYD86943.1 serine acetyltransferase [Nostoc sp. 'Peltigera membranacea cyanobiont' 213]OYE04403.1 serine acetyltransferase [Nostoc sp. 'Peltigera membranacea cyanobiont' 232]
MRDFTIKFVKTLRQVINAPMLILFIVSTKKEVILADVRRWAKNFGLIDSPDWVNMLYFLDKYPEFRTLYYYRIKKGNFIALIPMHIIKIFYKESPSLFLYCDNIGSGLFIQHGFSTIVSAESIGENCWINQQVTIGYSSKMERPTIGNNVTINAGAKVIGKVTLNDNVTVGANAVVVKSVPNNCVVVGIPAYIIRKDGVKVKEQLI